MKTDLPQDQSFQIERHGEIALVIPSPKVEEMHETMISQAATLVVNSLKEDPPAGIVIDLSKVHYFGSVFVSFLLRCHMLAKKQGSELVLAGSTEPALELLKLLDLQTLWAIYDSRQEALEALGGSD
jgi:anti-anti-sigma regulatory factor